VRWRYRLKLSGRKRKMDIEKFQDLMNNRFSKCAALMLGSKNAEYSRNNDKLHNFKVAGRIGGVTPEFALIGMFMKHLVSIFDIVNDLNTGTLPNKSILEEKITDTLNYLVLLEALITERYQNP
jgi:hypothetical protein